MKLDDVPKYLKNSPLYISFLENQEDDNEEIFIEDRFLKDNFELNNLSDLENLLDTLNFWLIEDEKIPYYEIILFVKNNKKIYEFDKIIETFFNMTVILGISNLYYSKNKDLLYNIVKTDDIYLYKYYKKLRFKYKPSLLNKSFISGNCAFKIFEYEFNKIFNKKDINYVLNIYEISNDIHIYNNRIRDIFFREFKKCKNKTKMVPYIFDYLKNINIRYIDCYIIELIILTENLELIDLIKDNVNFIYHLFKIEDNNFIIKIIDYFKLDDYKKILGFLLITEKYEIYNYYKNKFNNIILNLNQLSKIIEKANSNEIFKYIKLNNIIIKYDDIFYFDLNEFIIKLLYPDNYKFNDKQAITAIYNDNVEILKFMYSKYYRGNENVFYQSLINNSYKCMEFLFENKCPFDKRIYELLDKFCCKCYNCSKSANYIYNKIQNKKIIDTKYIEDIT